MITYARVTLENGKRLILRVTAETERVLTGIEVDKEGEAVRRKRASDGVLVDETKHIIDKKAITNRVPMVMNNTFAMLEVDKLSPETAADVLKRNRAMCGYCNELQKTNPGEWCIAHQDAK